MLKPMHTKRAYNLSVKLPKKNVYIAVALLMLLFVIALNLVLINKMAASKIVAIDFGLLLFSFFLYLSLEKIIYGSPKNSFHIIGLLVLLGLSIFGSVLLEFLTVFGTPGSNVFNVQDWSAKRIIFFSFVAYCLATVGFILIKGRKSKKNQRLGIFKSGKPGQKGIKILYILIFLLAIFLVSIFIGYAINYFLFIDYEISLLFSFLALLTICLFIFSIRKRFSIESTFLVLILGIGLSMSLVPPAQTGITWDDQIHYSRAVAVSYVGNPVYTTGDLILTELAYHPDDYLDKNISASIDTYDELINNQEGNLNKVRGFNSAGPDATSVLSISSIGYIPNAIGLWTGRLLHLNVVDIVLLGRLSSFLIYVIVCYYSIKLVPIKKVLLASVAILPINLFQASSYTYDAWIVASSILAISITIRLFYKRDHINWITIFGLIIIYLIAVASKAVYFPLLALMFLIPTNGFGLRQRQVFHLVIILAMLFLVVSFVAPFLSFGIDNGDVRSGNDVNPRAQVSFILHDPLAYLGIMSSFMLNYVNPSLAWTTNFGYLGNLSSFSTTLSILPGFVLFATSILDTNKKAFSMCRWRVRLWGLLAVYFSMVLIITALYVSYNAVGSSVVGGVQARYLAPLLFPFFALCLSMKITKHFDSAALQFTSLGIISFVNLLCVWMYFVLPMTV